LLGFHDGDGGVLGVAVGADLVRVGLAHRRAADHHLDPLAVAGLGQGVDGALHRRHGGGHQRGDSHDLGTVLLDGGDELLGRHVASQIDDLEARPFQHHGHQVLADVVEVPLGGADHDHAQVLLLARGGGDERLEEVEPGVHRARGEEHLGHVVLVAAELLPHHVHAGDEAPEDELLRVHRQRQAVPGLPGHRLLVPENQGPRHGGVVEVAGGITHARVWIPPLLAVG
jgi:hypothetical protein